MTPERRQQDLLQGAKRQGMKSFLYLDPDDQAPILIYAKSRPSIKNVPNRGTWIVKEWNGDEWAMPCFPEITWGTLDRLQFIGRVK